MASPADRLTRIAVVDAEKCKPKKCRQECKQYCPVVRSGECCCFVIYLQYFAYHPQTLNRQSLH